MSQREPSGAMSPPPQHTTFVMTEAPREEDARCWPRYPAVFLAVLESLVCLLVIGSFILPLAELIDGPSPAYVSWWSVNRHGPQNCRPKQVPFDEFVNSEIRCVVRPRGGPTGLHHHRPVRLECSSMAPKHSAAVAFLILGLFGLACALAVSIRDCVSFRTKESPVWITAIVALQPTMFLAVSAACLLHVFEDDCLSRCQKQYFFRAEGLQALLIAAGVQCVTFVLYGVMRVWCASPCCCNGTASVAMPTSAVRSFLSRTGAYVSPQRLALPRNGESGVAVRIVPTPTSVLARTCNTAEVEAA